MCFHMHFQVNHCLENMEKEGRCRMAAPREGSSKPLWYKV